MRWRNSDNYYLLRKDYGNAEKQIRHALEIDPEHYSANFFLLTLYTRTGDARREAQEKRFEELKIPLRNELKNSFASLRSSHSRPPETFGPEMWRFGRTLLLGDAGAPAAAQSWTIARATEAFYRGDYAQPLNWPKSIFSPS